MTPPVTIVLSCYDGAAYLPEQLESIRGQTWRDWRLLIRDDGSSDATPAILERAAQADGRITRIMDDRGNLGPVGSFGRLLELALGSGARYVALADQDDVWRADKLERQLALLEAHDSSHGADQPCLVHSDLAVVGSRLEPIHDSYFGYQRLDCRAPDPLRRLLLQNFVTGCTVVVNRALLRAALPMPRVVMHDWWLAQCAAALGRIVLLPEATVLYRQHAANVVGSRGAVQLYLNAFRRPREWWARGGRNFGAAGQQACELAARLESLAGSGMVEPGTFELVQRTCAVLRGDLRPLERCREVSRLRIRPRSLTVPIFFYLRMLVGLPDDPRPRRGPESRPGMAAQRTGPIGPGRPTA